MSKSQWFLDRIEGNQAILINVYSKKELEIPKQFLPKTAKEGDYLKIEIELDKAGSLKERKDVSRLINELESN